MAKLTPVRAIRQKCLDCCNGQSAEVRLCTCKTCPLYGCRMGHRPKGEQFTTETYREEKSPRRDYCDRKEISNVCIGCNYNFPLWGYEYTVL